MLRAVVIILAVGIVVIGALLIKTLVKNNSLKDSKKTTTGKEIVTEAEDEMIRRLIMEMTRTVDRTERMKPVRLHLQMLKSLLLMQQEPVELPVHGRPH